MNSLSKSIKKASLYGFAIFLPAVAIYLLNIRPVQAVAVQSPSLSIGLPMDGNLEMGEVLPAVGQGYAMMDVTRNRRNRFGVVELVMLVKDAGFQVSKRHGGGHLAVGDLSARRGGPVDRHASHQSGRDVDLGFYAVDNSGQPVALDAFIAFDRNGYSVDPPMVWRFDAARNWTLIRRLLESPHAQVQWIFVADHLKNLLLDQAAAQGAPPDLRSRAMRVLRQPGKNLHWDHFHVRIACPPSDLPHCGDRGAAPTP